MGGHTLLVGGGDNVEPRHLLDTAPAGSPDAARPLRRGLRDVRDRTARRFRRWRTVSMAGLVGGDQRSTAADLSRGDRSPRVAGCDATASSDDTSQTRNAPPTSSAAAAPAASSRSTAINPGAFRPEPTGGCPSDAAGGTGDDRDPSAQPTFHAPSSSLCRVNSPWCQASTLSGLADGESPVSADEHVLHVRERNRRVRGRVRGPARTA